VFDKLDEVIGGMWPGVPAVPVMDFGASDSKYTRAAGMPTYAMSSIFADVDDVRAHGRDERIGVPQFYEGVEFTYRIMKRMSRAD
jgi:acetylornithine deacetylase/succinyl-diaminopimelate desuccinylase-like protein